MHKIFLPMLIFSFITITHADFVFQTDWSGGSGFCGPVLEYSTEFYIDTDVNWGISPGDIVLEIKAQSHTVDATFNEAASVYSEDIDGDGDMDVLGAAEYANDKITWWENFDGLGTFWIEHTVAQDSGGSSSVYSEDIDSDGDMDVLGAAYNRDCIYWWENYDGSGTSWIEHTVVSSFDNTRSVYSVDMDSDGDMDVLGAAFGDDRIAWWENYGGSGTFWIDHTVDATYWGAYSVHANDIDGDGDLDVLGASYYADHITWWENFNGSGTSWIEHTIDGDFDNAWSVNSEDIDGDGDMDVLGAASQDDDIS